mmetsp:Transcript_39808/g.104153  ORF Transcript_39808/g.104153 Transcript_39808/m.104153 type:complete len:234 (+) Transcript_39808:57-758(+)
MSSRSGLSVSGHIPRPATGEKGRVSRQSSASSGRRRVASAPSSPFVSKSTAGLEWPYNTTFSQQDEAFIHERLTTIGKMADVADRLRMERFRGANGQWAPWSPDTYPEQHMRRVPLLKHSQSAERPLVGVDTMSYLSRHEPAMRRAQQPQPFSKLEGSDVPGNVPFGSERTRKIDLTVRMSKGIPLPPPRCANTLFAAGEVNFFLDNQLQRRNARKSGTLAIPRAASTPLLKP